MSRRVIGLYGGSGAGKSSVARWLQDRGALVIDADMISREVSAPDGSAYPELRQAFPDCFLPNGTLDRRKLGSRVFANAEERRRLERITHPHMRRRMQQILENSAQELAVLDCAVLLEPAFRDLATERWLVTAPAAVRRERIEHRDHLSAEMAAARLAAQTPEAELVRAADRVISNDGTESELTEQLEAALEPDGQAETAEAPASAAVRPDHPPNSQI